MSSNLFQQWGNISESLFCLYDAKFIELKNFMKHFQTFKQYFHN